MAQCPAVARRGRLGGRSCLSAAAARLPGSGCRSLSLSASEIRNLKLRELDPCNRCGERGIQVSERTGNTAAASADSDSEAQAAARGPGTASGRSHSPEFTLTQSVSFLSIAIRLPKAARPRCDTLRAGRCLDASRC